MRKVAVVTGGSSGIGLSAAKMLSERGCKVYEISRRSASNPGIIHLHGDVSDDQALSETIRRVYRQEGRIDILICNAGFPLFGAVEFTEREDMHCLFDVNFFGVANAASAVLPLMRERGGRIVCISSMAGAMPIPFHAFYSASKAAVTAFSQALANEMKDFGISVCAVMPGDTDTGYVRPDNFPGNDVYKGKIEHAVRTMERDEKNGMKPEKAGAFVCKVALKKRVSPVYTIGTGNKILIFLKRLLPNRFVRFVIRRLYAK